MDVNTINGVLRALLPAIIAYLVGKGTIPAGDYGTVIASFTALIAAAWSIWSNKPKDPAAPSA